MSKIALLGCGGFIGSHFLDAFLSDPTFEIEGWDWDSEKIKTHLNHPAFSFHQGDLYTFPNVENHLAKADVVIALAAICNPSEYNLHGVDVIESNFIQPRRIADICASQGKWLIQFSTSEVYGQTLAYWTGQENPPPAAYELDEESSPLLMGPVSGLRWSYACAKQLLERYILALHREKGLKYTIIRPFNFLGTRMDYLPGIEGDGLPRVLACFTAALLERRPLTLVDGGYSRRTFLAVEEAVGALRLMLEQPGKACNKVFNIGHPGNEISIRGLAELMRDAAAELTGDETYKNHPMVDVPALEFYGDGYEDSDRRMPRIDRARQLLGWAPVKNLRQILRPVLADAFKSYLSLSAHSAQ